MTNMYRNFSLNYQQGQDVIQDNISCFRFPVFMTENVSQKLIVSNCVINFLLLVTAIIGNILVLSAVWKTPSLRSPSIILLCGLAATDLVVGLVVQPVFLSMELMLLRSNSEYHCGFGKAFIILSYLVCGASFLTITAVSLDRLLAIQCHLRYASIVTIPRVIYGLALNLLLSGFLAGFILWNHGQVFLVVMSVVVAICLCLSTYAHVKIFLVVRHHQHQIQAQVEAVQAGNGLNVARFKKTAVNAFVVYCLLLLCYTPLQFTLIVTSKEDIKNSTVPMKALSAIAWKLSTTLVFLNSSLNPVIYCWRIREMRNAVKRTLREICRKE